jgi:membrane protease YdiL (CAAX protease family)
MDSTEKKPTSPSPGLKKLVARRPLTAVLLLGFALAYSLNLVWGLAYHGAIPGGGLADAVHIAPDELTGFLAIVSFFPAALYVTWASEGRSGVKALVSRMTRWRVSIRWWVAVLFALPLATVGSAILLGDDLRPVSMGTFILTQLLYLVINFCVTNFWEEAVWAGVFQTRLERRHNIFVASVLTAVPFAGMHLPLVFFLDEPVTASSLAGAFVLYLVLGLLVRPLFAIFLRGAGDSVLLVALMHSVFNRTNNENGIAAALLDGEMRGVATFLAVLVVAVTTALLIRPRLSRGYRRHLDAVTAERTALPHPMPAVFGEPMSRTD